MGVLEDAQTTIVVLGMGSSIQVFSAMRSRQDGRTLAEQMRRRVFAKRALEFVWEFGDVRRTDLTKMNRNNDDTSQDVASWRNMREKRQVGGFR